jgi:hypothetical protein
MSVEKRNRRFHPLLATVVAAVGMGALALPTSSADAQIFFGCGIGGCGVGLGVPAPIYARPYYAPYVYAPRPYYYPW